MPTAQAPALNHVAIDSADTSPMLVGNSRVAGAGPSSCLMKSAPPAARAGKSFTISTPISSAVAITVSRHAPAGAASALASHAFIEAGRRGRFTFTARPDTPLAVIYVRDVLRAFVGLLAAPAAGLSCRVYNIAGMTVTPGEIAAAIQRRLPDAVLDFAPDDEVDRVLAGWPGAIDDATARRDWRWEPEWDLERMADDFLASLSAAAEDRP